MNPVTPVTILGTRVIGQSKFPRSSHWFFLITKAETPAGHYRIIVGSVVLVVTAAWSS